LLYIYIQTHTHIHTHTHIGIFARLLILVGGPLEASSLPSSPPATSTSIATKNNNRPAKHSPHNLYVCDAHNLYVCDVGGRRRHRMAMMHKMPHLLSLSRTHTHTLSLSLSHTHKQVHGFCIGSWDRLGPMFEDQGGPINRLMGPPWDQGGVHGPRACA